MRYLIISDVHANLEALEAVLEDAAGNYDKVICCGDVAGYCADPEATTTWVRENAAVTVRGNHDKAVAGSSAIEWFNDAARAATLWTRESLSPENLEFLRDLPRGPLQCEGFQIFHGSPLDEDDYIVKERDASLLYGYLEAPLSFFGHTHLQGGFLVHRNGIRRINQVDPTRRWQELVCPDDYAVLVNPGSVGQPRDRDNRAAYAIYHAPENRVVYHRVEYDIEKAQSKIRAAGLPEMLARRLALGG